MKAFNVAMTSQIRTSKTLASVFMALAFGGVVTGCSASDTSEGSVASTRESLFIGPSGHNLDYQLCATEGQNCVIGGSKYVAYGAGSSFSFKSITNTFSCSNATFGGDPAPGQVKSCYFANFWFNAPEGSVSPGFGNNRWIAYGANGSFNFLKVNGSYSCSNATFGGDPAPGVVKACYVAVAEYGVAAANEGQTFSAGFHTPLAFGANGRFAYAFSNANQTLTCSAAIFGNFDPAPGVVKSCYTVSRPHLVEENQNYSGLFNGDVYYSSGLNGNFFNVHGASSGPCTSAAFGGDPHVGVVKHCYGVSVPL